ncbi:MAG TPA: hypothetical protein VK638_12070, partial [Edaphobacter sp.]|nr:hypothetical protein [Edaphobacter sp.]
SYARACRISLIKQDQIRSKAVFFLLFKGKVNQNYRKMNTSVSRKFAVMRKGDHPLSQARKHVVCLLPINLALVRHGKGELQDYTADVLQLNFLSGGDRLVKAIALKGCRHKRGQSGIQSQ